VDGGLGSPGIVTPPNCNGGQFSEGTLVVLDANPAPGFLVHAWRGTDNNASTSITNTATMAYDRRVGVHYVAQGDPTVPVSRGTPGGVAKVYGSGVGLESVIGPDNRVRITNTTDVPWRRIADLDVKLADGSWASCTGFFLGRRVVATAGHCVFDSEFGGWAQEIKVMPGRDSFSQPYGSSTSSDLHSISGWVNSGLTEYDFGAIVLPDDSLGDQVGWFDHGYYSDAYVLSLTGDLAGYPAQIGFSMRHYSCLSIVV
jgi:V8-like Glu-specific endopeptidase